MAEVVDSNTGHYSMPNISPPNSTATSSSTEDSNESRDHDPDIEDWDEEIRTDTEYKSVLLTCEERKEDVTIDKKDFQKVVNRYPPAKQAYSSTASYDSFVDAKNRMNELNITGQLDIGVSSIVKGQFDDAD